MTDVLFAVLKPKSENTIQLLEYYNHRLVGCGEDGLHI